MPGPSERFEFPGHEGQMLAARLDKPNGKPVAYAVFAHCFTCSKDVAAAGRISRTLAEQGIAVLRFDFTGLGHSEGEFENTNFSSNKQDLIAAANYLRQNLQAPKLLIGHSLGGAAVLALAFWAAVAGDPQAWAAIEQQAGAVARAPLPGGRAS